MWLLVRMDTLPEYGNGLGDLQTQSLENGFQYYKGKMLKSNKKRCVPCLPGADAPSVCGDGRQRVRGPRVPGQHLPDDGADVRAAAVLATQHGHARSRAQQGLVVLL